MQSTRKSATQQRQTKMFDAHDKEIVKLQLRVIVPYLSQLATFAINNDEMDISSSAVKALSQCNDILDAIATDTPGYAHNIAEIEKGVHEVE